LFFIVIVIVYFLWAIQPLSNDEWGANFTPYANKVQPLFPKTGQEIRYCFSSESLLPNNQFSLFRPWTLFSAIFFISLFWRALINEPIAMRAGLTLLTALGFPYLGHIGPWNLASSMYTVSLAWMMVWYAVFRKIRYGNTRFALKAIVLLFLTFIAASWHEVWLVTFFGIVVYLFFDVFYLSQEQGKFFKSKSFCIFLSVILAYILAVNFYIRGGSAQFIDRRVGASGLFATLFNWPHAIKAFLLGTKENLVLIKDSLPVFLLIIYAKLNKNFKTKLVLDFKLLLVVALGAIFFTYVLAFIYGPPDWRVRCLCVFSLSFALYGLPKSILINFLGIVKKVYFIKAVRVFSVTLAVIWLSYNAYFTYVYINIDVVKWLKFRQMFLIHNLDAMQKLNDCTLPKDRPKGKATWKHSWGGQDDRYRFFVGPSDDLIHKGINTIWNRDKNEKK
jgi:hypothetical protein